MKYFVLPFFIFLILSSSVANLSFSASSPPPPASTSSSCKNALLDKFSDIKSSFSYRTLNMIFNFVGAEAYPVHFFKEKGIVKKIGRLVHEAAYLLFRIINPVPSLITTSTLEHLAPPLVPIFEKQWVQKLTQPAKEVLNKENFELLKKYDAVTLYDEKASFIKRFPIWSAIRRKLQRVGQLAVTLTLVFALNHAAMTDTSFTTSETYLKNTNSVANNEIVELIGDVLPFPHLAIRVGDRVFSYGYTHMSASSLEEYIREKEIRKEVSVPNKDQGTWQKIENAFGEELEKLPRSVQIVRLNLTESERNSLRQDLELSVGKRYLNETLVNDCASMAARILRKNTSVYIPSLIDASPANIFFFLSALKRQGNPKVSEIYQLTIESPTTADTQMIRNTAINILESKLFIFLFLINQTHRAVIDLIYSDDSIQVYDPEVQSEIELWKLDGISKLLNNPEFKFLEKTVTTSEDSTKLLNTILDDFQMEQEVKIKEILDDPSLDLRSRTLYHTYLVVLRYRIEYLKRKLK